MTVYVAILSSRKPNMLALENASELVKQSVRPIIEVVAGSNDTEIKAVARRVVEYVRKSNPDGSIDLALDTAPLADVFGPESAREALRLLTAGLGHYSFRPVLHADRATGDDLREIRQAVIELQTGVCLRVGAPFVYTLRDPHLLLDQLDEIGVSIQQADLILDCGYLKEPSTTGDLVAIPLEHLLDHPWQSVTVAAGAFPPPGEFSPPSKSTTERAPRREADLWRLLSSFQDRVSYGDYGVDHPGLIPGKDNWPTPNLRYTVQQEWKLYYWPKGNDRRNSPFFDLCKVLVKSPDWPLEGAAFSWGDEQIARAACEESGPGGPTQWKAYSLSHHLAAIVKMLGESSQP
ncbi:beta family protein [Nonomuraea sp. NPDC049637]|uniref:beta family protein n=1 Tax=Nonomuraea sp. NPDC049637 TaxID=3154356 RepID=UPI00343FAC28